jgi:hypothetical protein
MLHSKQQDLRGKVKVPTFILASLLLAGMMVFISGCGQSQTPEPPESPVTEPPADTTQTEAPQAIEKLPDFDPADKPIFGYGDLKGMYAIALSDPKTIQPQKYTSLALPNGEITGIRYEGIQPPGSKDNAMDISSNFEQRYGAVYRLSSGKIKENDSITFMTETFVAQHQFYTLTSINKASEDKQIRGAVELDKGLKLKAFWHLYDVEGGSKVWLAQFEPNAGAALASLIFEHKGKRWYADFPAQHFAELDLYSWRVDDGGEILPESFIVGWIADREEVPELALYWRGAEGELLYWLKGKNSKAVPDGQDGQLEKGNEAFRYWAAY